MCRHYSYLGSRRDGGFAEYVAVPADNLIELPDEVSFEEAAMLEPMAVAVHAMRRVMPGVMDTVAVCGLGTIGLLLVTGTWNSSFTHEADDDWHYVLERLRQKKIAPAQLISHRFSLEELEQGYHIMRDKTEDYVKIMGQMD